MKVADAVAKVLKAEGVEYLFAYPVNPIIEAAAKLDIRPIIVRQETYRAAHGRRAEPAELRRKDRRLLHAERGRARKMLSAASPKLMAIPRRLSYCRPVIRAASTKFSRISIPPSIIGRSQNLVNR